MAITQLRGNKQIMNASVTVSKLSTESNVTWAISSDNTSTITGLATPVNANDVAIKSYVDGLVNTAIKAPDGYATNAAGDYPTDYKSTGAVSIGDSFYITDVSNGTTVGTKTVNVGDMLVALVDAPGNTDTNWTIVESNRDQASETVKGVAQIATQTETNNGLDDTKIVTPLKLATYVSNEATVAGAGLTKTGNTIDVVATDVSLLVNADDIGVNVGNTNGTSLEVSASGLELASTVTGARAFGTAANDVTLAAQPDGTVNLAVSTTKYVDDEITSNATVAGDGLTKTGTTIDVVAADASLVVNANDVAVQVGTTNGTSFEVSATGLELTSTVTGARTFTAGAGNDVVLDTDSNRALLTAQPDGAAALAIATTKYVDDKITSATTEVFGEAPTVTDGSADVTLANTPTANTERVYLNGLRMLGQGNDYSIAGTTITFASNLATGDIIIVDYKH